MTRPVSTEVVGLGAWCEFVYPDASRASPGSVIFDVDEFADLSDGRRIFLHTGERGFGSSGPPLTAAEPLGWMTAESITADVLTTVFPDDDPPGEEHPYAWLAGLLNMPGVTADQLRAVPYTVEFGPVLRELLERQTR